MAEFPSHFRWQCECPSPDYVRWASELRCDTCGMVRDLGNAEPRPRSDPGLDRLNRALDAVIAEKNEQAYDRDRVAAILRGENPEEWPYYGMIQMFACARNNHSYCVPDNCEVIRAERELEARAQQRLTNSKASFRDPGLLPKVPAIVTGWAKFRAFLRRLTR